MDCVKEYSLAMACAILGCTPTIIASRTLGTEEFGGLAIPPAVLGSVSEISDSESISGTVDAVAGPLWREFGDIKRWRR